MRTKILNGILAQITGTPDCKERVKNTEKKPLFQELRRPGAETLTKKNEIRILILKCRANLANPRKETKGNEVTCNLAMVLMTKKSEGLSLYKDNYNHHFQQLLQILTDISLMNIFAISNCIFLVIIISFSLFISVYSPITYF